MTEPAKPVPFEALVFASALSGLACLVSFASGVSRAWDRQIDGVLFQASIFLVSLLLFTWNVNRATLRYKDSQ